jgi:hypothetical protein
VQHNAIFGPKDVTGQTAAQGASVQCVQAIETERSPGLPSSKNDYDTTYLFARKFGFADHVQKHQGREQRGVGGGYSARDQSRRLVPRAIAANRPNGSRPT